MAHPLTPREKVARIIDPAAFLFTADELMKGDPSQFNALAKADQIFAALASSGDQLSGNPRQLKSGDHAELIGRLRKVESGQDDGFLPGAACTNWYRNPEGPAAADALEALLAEVAALREDRDQWRIWYRKASVEINAQDDRATEAERKLAEAVGIASKLSAAISWLDYPFIDNNTSEDELRSRVGFMMKDAERPRAILSKEAERG